MSIRIHLQRDERKKILYLVTQAVIYRKYRICAPIENYIFLFADRVLFKILIYSLGFTRGWGKKKAQRRHSRWTSIFLRGTEELQATPTSDINGCGCKWNEAISWRRAVRVTNEERLEKPEGWKKKSLQHRRSARPSDCRAKNNVAVGPQENG